MPAHRSELRVRFYELDPYGHVNHAVYVQYFEVARVELLTEIGYGLDRLLAAGHQLVVSRLRTRFLASAVLADDLVVETGLVEAGRVRALWAQRLRRAGQTIATQEVELGDVGTDGRIVRFPAELVRALEPYRVPPDWLGRERPG